MTSQCFNYMCLVTYGPRPTLMIPSIQLTQNIFMSSGSRMSWWSYEARRVLPVKGTNNQFSWRIFTAFAGVCLTNLCKATLECWFLLRKRTCKIPKVPDNFDSTEAMLPRQPPASSDVTLDSSHDVTHVHKPGNKTSSLLLSETCESTS